MFIDENKIQSIRQLVKEFKAYVEMQKEYTRLELTEKLTLIFSTMILIMVLILLGVMVLLYLSLSLAYILAPYVGGLLGSYAIIAGLVFLLAVFIAIFRKKLIINPIANFFAKHFLKD